MLCFYDLDPQTEVELRGKHLAEHLPSVYGNQAAVVVVFVSAEYASRGWTRLEHRAALSRAMQENQEYLLPVRFDDTDLPGLLPDVAVIDLRTRPRSPGEIAGLIIRKLDTLGITGPALAAGPAGAAPPAVPSGRSQGPPAAQRTKARRRGASGVPAGSSRRYGNGYLRLTAAGAVTIVLVIALTLLVIHRSPVTGGTRGAGASAVTARVYSGASYGFNAPNRVAADGTHIWIANVTGNSVTELTAR